eukprot:TRINITY_DN106022_c0_g1_i1.p1 TRINITY_DN106022_c0_g1~~TRINITY_DN106022_c0_g1_i1.p1  ORF type:complete len:325 (+),score=29.91 TRINITY_DN106022_c0_g1_i1:2322-3296(+)
MMYREEREVIAHNADSLLEMIKRIKDEFHQFCPILALLCLHKQTENYIFQRQIIMAQPEVGTCQDCGKKLLINKDPNDPIKILTKDQLLLHDTKENPSLSGAVGGASDLLNYPICLECLDRMINEVDASIRGSETTRQEYFTNLTGINNEVKSLTSIVLSLAQPCIIAAIQTQELDESLKTISSKESELHEKLEALKEESKKYETELDAISKEAKDLEYSEQQYWEKISEFESKLLDTEEESGKAKSALGYISQEYQRLAAINVISDAFKITCPERVAAINGFRLGRLQTEDVFFLFKSAFQRSNGKRLMWLWDMWRRSWQFFR